MLFSTKKNGIEVDFVIEKRYSYDEVKDEVEIISDNETGKEYYVNSFGCSSAVKEIVCLLNDQHSIIKELREELEEVKDELGCQKIVRRNLEEFIVDEKRNGVKMSEDEKRLKMSGTRFNALEKSAFNMIGFLSMKGLLKKELLFSERLKLEKEFNEWCEYEG